MAQIFLVGYRATGKTTVGRIVAARLGWGFVDADTHLEATAGRSVREIFDADGESAFRTLEAQVLRQLALDSAWDNHVVSTGGGVVLRRGNREFLRTGFVARLVADAATIHARMAADGLERRPNLTAAGGLQEVTDLLASREPLYREVADISVDTVGRSPEEVASDIIAGYFDAPPERQD